MLNGVAENVHSRIRPNRAAGFLPISTIVDTEINQM